MTWQKKYAAVVTLTHLYTNKEIAMSDTDKENNSSSSTGGAESTKPTTDQKTAEEQERLKKRIEELRKRDPFIYK